MGPSLACPPLFMQVHDELLFEVRTEALPLVAALVKQEMEGAVALRVPLPVKLNAGPSWGELQEYCVVLPQ